MDFFRPTWVEINIENLIYNIRQIKIFLGNKVKIAIVLKANAYGHGAVEIAKNLEHEEVDYICVASLQEALELRKNSMKVPILIMGYVPIKYIQKAIENNITITIFDKDYAKEIYEICKKYNLTCKVHIKIDTGFNRLGFKLIGDYENDKYIIDQLKEIINNKKFLVEGIFSHLSLTDDKSDKNQYDIFLNTLKYIDNHNDLLIKHICDSIGMCKYKELHMDMVRVGSCIYGYNSRSEELKLKEVMTFKSKIIQIKEIKKGEGVSYDSTFKADKDMKIGIVACGYADGIPRSLSNKGYVVVNSKKANIIGKMCMDQSIIDLSNLDERDYKCDVIFYGENGPSLSMISKIADTNKNEILGRVSKRVIKVYIDNKGIIKVLDELNNK
ncbi:MAG: alanine racemase [Romboutsia sp.]|uniref:alanine racemase n=1 Tax=Romboutsia sp. TaxID=1965302 RepID=UPI003F416BEF